MTPKKKENPQSKLSKDLLAQALLNLMEEKPYKQINITELARRADISRRTFYRHFSNIDDILDYIFQEMADNFLLFRIEQNPTDLKSIVLTFFSFFEQQKHFLFLLMNNDLLYLILQKFLPIVKIRLLDFYGETNTSDIVDYKFCFSSGGMWNLLIKYLEDENKLSPEEISNITIEIIKNLN